MPDDVTFQTKPQIATDLIRRVLLNGILVWAWTFDELYGRDSKFLDALEEQDQRFIGEVPSDFRGWLEKPRVLRSPAKNERKKGRRQKYPRLARKRPACEVRNLLRYSPVFREQRWQRYRIKDTDRGPCVWEVKWAKFWRKTAAGLPSRRHCLIVARYVLTGEVKYFVANCVPGDRGVTLRRLLQVAFRRWSVESCFRESKEELGLDHYEVRGWRCLHRHFYLTQLSHLFCARIRQQYDICEQEPIERLHDEDDEDTEEKQPDRLTVEQVRSAMNVWLSTADLPPSCRRERYERELEIQEYYQRRNRQARKSHTKTRVAKLRVMGIDPDRIKSCL